MKTKIYLHKFYFQVCNIVSIDHNYYYRLRFRPLNVIESHLSVDRHHIEFTEIDEFIKNNKIYHQSFHGVSFSYRYVAVFTVFLFAPKLTTESRYSLHKIRNMNWEYPVELPMKAIAIDFFTYFIPVQELWLVFCYGFGEFQNQSLDKNSSFELENEDNL